MRTNIIPREAQIKRPFFLGLASLVLGGIIFLVLSNKLPPQIPLFYSRPWGEEQLGISYFLGIPLLLSGAFLVANTIAASYLSDYPLLKKTLVIGAATASILASITIIRIILLVI